MRQIDKEILKVSATLPSEPSLRDGGGFCSSLFSGLGRGDNRYVGRCPTLVCVRPSALWGRQRVRRHPVGMARSVEKGGEKLRHPVGMPPCRSGDASLRDAGLGGGGFLPSDASRWDAFGQESRGDHPAFGTPPQEGNVGSRKSEVGSRWSGVGSRVSRVGSRLSGVGSRGSGLVWLRYFP